MGSDHAGQWNGVFLLSVLQADESDTPSLGGGQYGVASSERHNQEGYKDARLIPSVHLQSLLYTKVFSARWRQPRTSLFGALAES